MGTNLPLWTPGSSLTVSPGIAAAAACDSFAENGKGFTNQMMTLGIIETVAIFVMAFSIVLLAGIN